jgi:hypothetical protein
MIVQMQCALVGAEDVVRKIDASESTGSIDVVSIVAIVEGSCPSRPFVVAVVVRVAWIPERVVGLPGD